MRSRQIRTVLLTVALAIVVASLAPRVGPLSAQSQQAAGPNARFYDLAPAIFNLDQAYLRWSLLPSDAAYAAIDGSRVKRMLSDIAGIARHSKVDGNQYWGRIAGTKYDQMTQQYVLGKFREFGLRDTHIQEMPLPPQWMAKSWTVAIVSGGQRIPLTAAFPLARAASTPGVDLPIAWVGLGGSLDFAGRDVRGKAVVIESIPEPSVFAQTAQFEDALRHATDGGAAAVLIILDIPGNASSQMGGGIAMNIPAFTVGMEDGKQLKTAIDQSARGGSASVHLALDASMVPDLKTGSVWGVLPGTTDENVLVISHLDSYFEGAVDNASGVATMLSLAEYFVKLPRAQRRRTITFVGTAAHHAGSPGTAWMHQNMKDYFEKTALILNCEHTAADELYWWGRPPVLRQTTATAGDRMFTVIGSNGLKDAVAQSFSRFGVGVLAVPEAQANGDMSPISRDAPSLQTIMIPLTYHTDLDTPELVPAPGLESVARAYAYVIDRVNRMSIAELSVQPSGTVPTRRP